MVVQWVLVCKLLFLILIVAPRTIKSVWKCSGGSLILRQFLLNLL